MRRVYCGGVFRRSIEIIWYIVVFWVLVRVSLFSKNVVIRFVVRYGYRKRV